jgi:hypothetical protein
VLKNGRSKLLHRSRPLVDKHRAHLETDPLYDGGTVGVVQLRLPCQKRMMFSPSSYRVYSDPNEGWSVSSVTADHVALRGNIGAFDRTIDLAKSG